MRHALQRAGAGRSAGGSSGARRLDDRARASAGPGRRRCGRGSRTRRRAAGSPGSPPRPWSARRPGRLVGVRQARLDRRLDVLRLDRVLDVVDDLDRRRLAEPAGRSPLAACRCPRARSARPAPRPSAPSRSPPRGCRRAPGRSPRTAGRHTCEASSRLPPSRNVLAASGTRLTNATFGLSGPRDSAKPISSAISDRVGDQQRDQQRRAAQDLQVLEQQPAHGGSVAPLVQEAHERRLEVARCRSADRLLEQRRGEPVNSSSPSASTSTRSAWRSASPTLWVEYTTVVPRPARRADELPQALALARVQRRRGLVEQQHRRLGRADPTAMLTRWRLPPDSRANLVVGAIGQPGLVQHARHRRVGVADALQAGEQAQVLGHRQLGVDGGLLRHPADLARRPAAPCPSSGGWMPARIDSSVVLPAPLGPMTRHQLAARGLERHAAQRVALAEALAGVASHQRRGR